MGEGGGNKKKRNVNDIYISKLNTCMHRARHFGMIEDTLICRFRNVHCNPITAMTLPCSFLYLFQRASLSRLWLFAHALQAELHRLSLCSMVRLSFTLSLSLSLHTLSAPRPTNVLTFMYINNCVLLILHVIIWGTFSVIFWTPFQLYCLMCSSFATSFLNLRLILLHTLHTLYSPPSVFYSTRTLTGGVKNALFGQAFKVRSTDVPLLIHENSHFQSSALDTHIPLRSQYSLFFT